MPPEDKTPAQTTDELARPALAGGGADSAKPVEAPAGLAGERQQAMRAMEGAERRARRETEERLTKEKEELEKRQREQVAKLRDLERQAQEKARQEGLAREAGQIKEQEVRLQKIEKAEAVIERLKQGPAALSPLRTLEADLAATIRRREISQAQIALQEQERRRQTRETKPLPAARPWPWWETLFVWLGIILLVGGSIALAVYLFKRAGSTPPATTAAPTVSFLMPIDRPVEIDLTVLGAAEINQLIQETLGRADEPGLVTAIYFTRQATSTTGKISTKERLGIRPVVAAADLFLPLPLQSFLGEDFVLGNVTAAAGQAKPFLILKTRSFDTSFSNLLKWEETMPRDLAQWFGQTATTTTNAGQWQDRLIRNLDSRALTDAADQLTLLYAFVDSQTLVVATAEETLLTVVGRLRPASQVR